MVGPEERDGGTVTHIWESSRRGQTLILYATITGSTDVKVEAAKLFSTAKLCQRSNKKNDPFLAKSHKLVAFQVLFVAIVTVHLLGL